MLQGDENRAQANVSIDSFTVDKTHDFRLSPPPALRELRAFQAWVLNIATHPQILYTSPVEYPFPPVGIVGAADGKNRRAFFCFYPKNFASRPLRT